MNGTDSLFGWLFAIDAACSAPDSAHSLLPVQDIHDPIGLLLMIRINYFHRLVMQRRRLPCLDAYMDNVNMTLWPKLKLALDNQLQSLNNCQVSLIKHSPGRTSGGAGARFSVDAKLAKHVEGITKRFSDLLLSLVILNQDFNQVRQASLLSTLPPPLSLGLFLVTFRRETLVAQE